MKRVNDLEKGCYIKLIKGQMNHLLPIAICEGYAEGHIYVGSDLIIIQELEGDGELFVYGLVNEKNIEAFEGFITEVIQNQGHEDYHNLTMYFSHLSSEAYYQSHRQLDFMQVHRGYLVHKKECSLPIEQLEDDYEYLVLTDTVLESEAYTNLETVKEWLDYDDKTNPIFKEIGYGLGIVSKERKLIISWCCFDFSYEKQFEIGIQTLVGFRKQGFATKTTKKTLAYLYEKGYESVGWHYWWYNTSSKATALKAGFHEEPDHVVLHCEFNEFDNMMLHAYWYVLLKDDVSFEQLYLKVLDACEKETASFKSSSVMKNPYMSKGHLYLNMAEFYSRLNRIDEGIACLIKGLKVGLTIEKIHLTKTIKALTDSLEWSNIEKNLQFVD